MTDEELIEYFRCIPKEELMMPKLKYPRKYRPEFAEVIVREMAAGYSKTAACAALGVGLDTLRGWVEQYPEMATAVKTGEMLRARIWEDRYTHAGAGHEVTKGIFALKNVAPEEWRDRRDIDMTSTDGSMSPKPTEIHLVAQPFDDEDDDSDDVV